MKHGTNSNTFSVVLTEEPFLLGAYEMLKL